MKFYFLLLVIFLVPSIFCIGKNAEDSEISADDLRLLDGFQLDRLADFVKGRGRGFVSKVPFEDLLEGKSETSDDLFMEEKAAAGGGGSFETFDPDIVMLGGGGQIEEEDLGFRRSGSGGIQTVPLISVPFQASHSVGQSHRKLKPGERLIIPNILMPTPRPRTESSTSSSRHDLLLRPQQRVRQKKPSTRRPPTSPAQPSNSEFEELARILQSFRNSQKARNRTNSASGESSYEAPFREGMKVEVRTTTQAPTTATTPAFRRQGLSVVVEEVPEAEEPAEFVISPLKERWQVLARPSPSPPRERPPTDSNPFGMINGIAIKPSQSESTEINVESDELVPITENEWEEKMRDISRKLGNYLLAIKKKKEVSGEMPVQSYHVDVTTTTTTTPMPMPTRMSTPMMPTTTGKMTSQSMTMNSVWNNRMKSKSYVTIIREGFIRQTGANEYHLSATITVVRDHGKVILVDTGLATDINGHTDLLTKLARLNISPPMVNYVVTTHGHPDHSGNLNDFPDAIHYQGRMAHHNSRFRVVEEFLHAGGRARLTPNIYLMRTPGHSAEDISVVVENTDKYGTIIIAGDTFISENDIDYPVMWRQFAWNESLQDESRKQIICRANFIVPGHGKVFRVTTAMKSSVNCLTHA